MKTFAELLLIADFGEIEELFVKKLDETLNYLCKGVTTSKQAKEACEKVKTIIPDGFASTIKILVDEEWYDGFAVVVTSTVFPQWRFVYERTYEE